MKCGITELDNGNGTTLDTTAGMEWEHPHLQCSHSDKSVLVVEEGGEDVEDGGTTLDELLQTVCLEGHSRDG